MRIALVTETFLPSTDGVVTRLMHAVDHFLDRGHEVLVIAPDLGVDEYRGARIVGMPTCQLSGLSATSEYRGARIVGMPTRELPLYTSREWSLPSREKEIERLAPLMRDRTDLRLAIVGHGPDIDYMEELFAGTNTIFTGFLHGDELSAAFASADYFVFPSVSETLGLVILEAMSSGTPVLAANSAPTREQITDRVTGMLWDGSDISTLATAIDTLDTNEHLRSTITRNALEVAACNTWADASEALLDQYRDVIARTEAAPERLVRSVSTR